MKIKISGSTTLIHFTKNIKSGFIELGHQIVDKNEDFEILQIHASPASIQEDLRLLKKSPRIIYLIHRPDEFLLHAELVSFFEDYETKFILFGDLVLEEKFWSERRAYCEIIPHPFMDHSLPTKRNGKIIVGSYTSWGEMRSLEHISLLAEEFKGDKSIEFCVGGTLNSKPLTLSDIPHSLTLLEEMFYPHFNVQLYHLNGHKRYGESSGSLHRGISIPIIFEANGIERLETLKVIKIESNYDLTSINFKKAADYIRFKIRESLFEDIEYNRLQSLKNTPMDFARKVLCLL